MNQAYDRIQDAGAELLAIHVECSPEGTRAAVRRHQLRYPMANDDQLRVVRHFSPTSTYLIDKEGIIRARWLDQIHSRAGPEAILEAISKLK